MIPLNGLVIMILLLLTLFLLFSLISYFINFTVYPVVERYLIKPYEKKMEEEKNGGKTEAALQEDPEAVRFYAQPEEDEDEDDDEDKMVYVNGRLIKKSELKSKNLDE